MLALLLGPGSGNLSNTEISNPSEALMVTSLAMDGYNFLKNEPVDGPTARPQTIEELDVRQSIVEDLALKILYLSGSLSISELSEKTRLSFEVAKELSSQLRTELNC
ncbi:MAG: hypothetical protein WAK26_01445, partial [Terracidiphilus sp.]